MLVNNLIDMIQILITYGVLFIILPAYVLYPVFKEKALSYRVFAYLLYSNLYISVLVFILGYSHLFYTPAVVIMLLLPLVYRTWTYRDNLQKAGITTYEMLRGYFGGHLYLKRIRQNIKRKYHKFYQRAIRGKVLEYLVFLALVLVVMNFYGYYKLHNNAYGVSDEEVHLYWIQALIGGDFFVSGMYPFGMHSVMTVLALISGLPAGRVVHVFSATILILTMATVYMLFRRFYTARVLIFASMLIWLLSGFGGINTYFRFQFTLPMEYGLFALFAVIYFMTEYIYQKERKTLLLFGTAICITFFSHFYLTMFVAFVCVAFGIANLVPIFKNKTFFPLVGTAIGSIIFSLVPFVVGLVLGYPFEQSIAWAIGVMNKDYSTPTEEGLPPEIAKVDFTNFKEVEKRFFDAMNSWGGLGRLEYTILLSLIGLSLLLCIIAIIVTRKNKSNTAFRFYLGMAIAWCFAAGLSDLTMLGYSALIEEKRVIEWVFIFGMTAFMTPFEIIYQMVCFILKKVKFIPIFLSIASVVVVIYIGYDYKYQKQERTCMQIQTEAAAKLCRELVDEYPKNSWTVVSPVNETSIVLNYGYHYELLDLADKLDHWSEDQLFTIPTKDVFFVIEKYPVMFLGVDVMDKNSLEGREKISRADLREPLGEYSEAEKSLIYQTQRSAIMARAYYWAKEYAKQYPHEMKVYYEDKETIIYHLEQNEYALNNLSIQY
ncbi:MAG: hypothetical protein K6G65_02590 [Lachnospiraceae bacterium]|nr:hypothetical protein [Lachnospiraceae bacterium]